MKKKLSVIVAIVALVAVGAAVAAWILNSTGTSGTGVIGTVTAPTVTDAASAAGSECFPGQTCDMVIVVNNPNTNALGAGWTNVDRPSLAAPAFRMPSERERMIQSARQSKDYSS
jgi:hypothetical protein